MCKEEGGWSDRPERAAWLSCVWGLIKDPLLHEKSSAVVEEEIERERGRKKKPLLGFAGDQYKRERWG